MTDAMEVTQIVTNFYSKLLSTESPANEEWECKHQSYKFHE